MSGAELSNGDSGRNQADPPSFDPLLGAPDVDAIEKVALPLGGDRAFLLRSVLSREECRHYIDVMERMGFAELEGSEGRYRSNTRVVADSPGLAALLWKRCGERFMADVLVGVGEPDPSLQEPFGANGLWRGCGINERFRGCKYTEDQHFAPHCDSMFARNERERSWKTIMIYLNDDFEGGSTNFLNNVAPIRYDDERRIRATPDQIRYQVTPEAGTALVFNHRMLHEGGLVTRGCKYILRSDVMYTRVGGEDMDPKDREALLLFRSAQDAEAEGEMGKAASLYRRAFKMSARLAEAYGNS